MALPICAESLVSGPGRLASGTDWWLTVMGRLEPGGSLTSATAQLNAISPALFQATLPPKYPAASVDKYLNLKLAAYDAASGISALRENYEAALWLLLGTAALVLLIACANLANLLLARASARQREIAVRLGLGASRGRIIRQLLTESLLLASIGAACGALLAGTLSRTLISSLRAADQTVVLDLGTDWRILGFAAGLGLVTCGLFGLAPALKATGIGASAVLKAHGRGMTASPERVGLRRGLVVGQVALSLVLLVGALLFARSFYNLVQVDPGFHGDGLLIAEIDLRQLDVVPDGRQRIRADVMAQLRGIPGVQSAAQTAIVPISGNAWGNDVWVTHQGERKQANAFFNRTSPDYFHTLGIPLVGGRDFDDAIDTPSSPLVAIVNEAFARALLNGASPVGTSFSVEATPTRPERSYDIVGVIRNAKYMTLREEMWPGVFLADSQSAQPSTYLQVLLRSTLPSDALAPQVTRRLADINPRMIVTYTVMTSQIADTLVRERLMATLSGFFGALAAILTLVGLYGVIAYTVARRTNEIGVRLALGANQSDVITMILREAGVLVLAGMAVGLLLTLASGQAASTLLFGLEPTDPLTLGVAILGLSVVALLASYAPARAAARIEPITALRIE